MKVKHGLYSAVLVLCTSGATYFVATSTAQQGAPAVRGTADTEYQAGATLYVQKAAEYRALAYQAFNVARWQLDADLSGKNKNGIPKAERKKPRAVMVDIDETMLDNSPAQAYGIKNRLPFELKGWYAWGEMRKAKAVPGAVEFASYAVSKGVKVFFVSNRDEDPQKPATIDNLKSVGFADVGPDNVLLRVQDASGNNISSKEPRRQFIMQKYRIVLFVGDNLDDHADVFERRSIVDRFAEVDRAKGLFGKRFIMLPNAMYGTWENAIYEYGQLTDAQKAEKRAAALELP
jgi:5'-nucleotidase (lipoprotein e(P4) family)